MEDTVVQKPSTTDFISIACSSIYNSKGYNGLDVNSVKCINMNPKLFIRNLKIIVVNCVCGPRNPAFTLKISLSVNVLIVSRFLRSTGRNSDLHRKREGSQLG